MNVRTPLARVVKKEPGIKLEVKKEPVKLKPDHGWRATDDPDVLEQIPMEPPLLDVLDSDEEELPTDGELMRAKPKGRPRAPWDLHIVSKMIVLRQVDVYSVGWNQQGCKWRRNIQEQVDDLDSRLKTRFANSVGEVSIYMETKMFHQDPPGTGHIGSNTEDIGLMMDNRHFKPWLADVKAHVKWVHDVGRHDRIAIACVCKAGRNRSVCGKTILNAILSRAGYLTNTDKGHLSKPGWWVARPCATCSGCIGMPREKFAMLEKCFKIWNSL